MAEKVLALNSGVVLSNGDTAKFVSTAGNTQYHFEIVPAGGNPVIGVWKDAASKGNGVARNKPGVPYVDHVTGKGAFIVTVDSTNPVVTLSVKANSWLKKVFGIG